MPQIPRGLRNNNPGNIDYNPRNDWQGQLGIEAGVTKPRFARFDSPENGIRALAKLLINYRGKDGMPGIGLQGIDTVRETINRWAPSVENNTEAYIKQVSAAAGVMPNESITIRDPRILLAVVTAIITHENGGNPYAPAVIAEGVRRALA
ncbi:structural protein P5 [Pseudomonas syringae]|uniref:Structural protein P5 n=1 Tax=Pseudomonas syringae TaxID=317 RepID=A0A085V3Z1_PSESX|nr:structural protein P5 [Pseudomonas syringae]KFE50154.1 structural protein P5 [Pseudomonas syringae]